MKRRQSLVITGAHVVGADDSDGNSCSAAEAEAAGQLQREFPRELLNHTKAAIAVALREGPLPEGMSDGRRARLEEARATLTALGVMKAPAEISWSA